MNEALCLAAFSRLSLSGEERYVSSLSLRVSCYPVLATRQPRRDPGLMLDAILDSPAWYGLGYAPNLRRSSPARPRTPEPNMTKLLGSGTEGSLKLKAPQVTYPWPVQ